MSSRPGNNSSEPRREFSDPVSFRTRAASRAASQANVPSSAPAESAALASTIGSLPSSPPEVHPTTETASSGMGTPEPESSHQQQSEVETESAANDNFTAAASGQGLYAQVLTGLHGTSGVPPPLLPSAGPSYSSLRSTQDPRWIQARIDNMDGRTTWMFRKFINEFRGGLQPVSEDSGSETESMSPASMQALAAAATTRRVAAAATTTTAAAAEQAAAAADDSSSLSSFPSVTTPSHLAEASGDEQ